MNIIEIGPNVTSIAGFKAERERREHRARIIVRRKHIPWSIRKYDSVQAQALETYFLNHYREAARRYAASAP